MKLDPSPSRVSLRDIAKNLGISHATVSLALRDHPRISISVTEKIKSTASEMGYMADPMLSALARYRKEKSAKPTIATIGWINAWSQPAKLRTYKEFDLYWKGASAAAEKFGYRLEEFQLSNKQDPLELHKALVRKNIRGLLLPPQPCFPEWGTFPWEKYSVVRFGRSLKHPNTHLVTSDHVKNTMMAFHRIRELGYIKIGYVTDNSDMGERGHLFEGGYLLASQRIPEPERVPVFDVAKFTSRGLPGAIISWLLQNGVEAILTDVASLPSILDRSAVNVPDAVALASTTILDSAIDAGIDQQSAEIGRVSFLLLNSLINDGSRGIPDIRREILIEGRWKDGRSLPLKAMHSDPLPVSRRPPRNAR